MRGSAVRTLPEVAAPVIVGWGGVMRVVAGEEARAVAYPSFFAVTSTEIW